MDADLSVLLLDFVLLLLQVAISDDQLVSAVLTQQFLLFYCSDPTVLTVLLF